MTANWWVPSLLDQTVSLAPFKRWRCWLVCRALAAARPSGEDSMNPPEGRPAVENRAPVYRSAPGESLGSLVAEATIKDKLARAKLYAERNALKAVALRPILELISADAAAAQAADRFRKVDQQLLSRRSSQLDLPEPGPATVSVGPGIYVFAPPYDHPQVGPDVGTAEEDSWVDVLAGKIHVAAYPKGKLDGAFSAVAGLGIDLKTSRDGTLEIRTYARISYYAQASGLIFDSHVQGDITTTVWDAAAQTHVAAPTDYQLFAMTNPSNWPGDITVSGDSLAVRFLARAGEVYQFWITASLSGDQSGYDHAMGWSDALGTIDAYIPFVVAELQ